MVIYIAIAVIVVIAAILIYRKKRKKDMAQGLQVYDEGGNVVVDMQTRTSKILGRVTTNGRDGSLTDSRLADGNMWAMVEKTDVSNSGAVWGTILVTSSGTTLSWRHIDISTSTTFIYGIY